MVRNFIDTSIKIHIDDVQSFVTFRISVDLFYFFNCDFARFGRKKEKSHSLQLFENLAFFINNLFAAYNTSAYLISALMI